MLLSPAWVTSATHISAWWWCDCCLVLPGVHEETKENETTLATMSELKIKSPGWYLCQKWNTWYNIFFSFVLLDFSVYPPCIELKIIVGCRLLFSCTLGVAVCFERDASFWGRGACLRSRRAQDFFSNLQGLYGLRYHRCWSTGARLCFERFTSTHDTRTSPNVEDSRTFPLLPYCRTLCLLS